MITQEQTEKIWKMGVKKGATVGDKVIATLDKNDKIIKVEVEKKNTVKGKPYGKREKIAKEKAKAREAGNK